MTTYTFETFVAEVEALFRASRRQRRGRLYWNALSEHRPGLARNSAIRGHDPFYDDERLEDFLQEVAYAR